MKRRYAVFALLLGASLAAEAQTREAMMRQCDSVVTIRSAAANARPLIGIAVGERRFLTGLIPEDKDLKVSYSLCRGNGSDFFGIAQLDAHAMVERKDSVEGLSLITIADRSGLAFPSLATVPVREGDAVRWPVIDDDSRTYVLHWPGAVNDPRHDVEGIFSSRLVDALRVGTPVFNMKGQLLGITGSKKFVVAGELKKFVAQTCFSRSAASPARQFVPLCCDPPGR